MKIEYHCTCQADSTQLLKVLSEEKIKIDFYMKRFAFDIYSDNPKCEEILNLIKFFLFFFNFNF